MSEKSSTSTIMTVVDVPLRGTSKRSRADAWIGADGDYLGVSSVYSLDQMAAAIAADESVCWHLAEYHDVDTSTASSLREWLDAVDVRPAKVPAATFHSDQWPYEIPVALDAKPGRGYVKVLGVSLA